jgi:hypothetical protein
VRRRGWTPFARATPSLRPSSPGAFSLSRGKRGEYLGIDIKAGADLSVYCWILGKDQTALLALPVPGRETRIENGRTLRYPVAGPIRLGSPSEDLFGCFGSEQKLPTDLHNSWMSLTGAGPTGVPIEVKRDDILRLLEMMRAQSGIVEAYAPVIVR